MKLFVAGLLTETNSFASCPTGLAAFEAEGLRRGPASAADPLGMAAALEAVRRTAIAQGWTVHEGLLAAAQSGGPVVGEAYATLRDEILADLAAAGPVDAVVLLLHGAMMADGCDDCEGDVLQRVRALVGPRTKVAAALDLHCHLTAAMCAHADLIVAYKEYPHIDIPETAARATELAIAAAHGRIQPHIAVHDCRMMGLWPTNREPLRGFVQSLRDLEGEDGILSISLGHGMSYADMAEAGAKLWVIADGDARKAADLAGALGRRLFELREAISTRYTPLAEAIATLERWDGAKPLGLADVADNPGGGA
ncbi:MAG: M81 family metallopeptidase, partial [Caulobacterales bacterium]